MMALRRIALTRPLFAGALLCGALVACTTTFSGRVHAQQGDATPPAEQTGETAQANAPSDDAETRTVQRAVELRERLTDIQQSIEDKRGELQKLEGAATRGVAPEGFDSEDEVKAKVEALTREIGDLRQSFEQIATAGVDKAVFEDAVEEQFDWQVELLEISKPIFDELRGLTERPRQIERLRRELARGEARLEAANKALEALAGIDPTDMPEAAAAGIGRLTSQWETRRKDTERTIEVARLQLDNLLNDDVSAWERIKVQAIVFVRGRGLTLAVALTTGIVVWLLLRMVLRYIQKKVRRTDRTHASTKYRLIVYGHRLISIIAVTAAVLATFSLMGDFLLLALGIIAIALTAISARKLLPRYVAEARLLIGIGPVREGERITYDGLPYQVNTINMYSVLRNPKLESVVRLPLRMLSDMVSRPCKEEPWFPTDAGDYVLLPDESFGQVVRQTPEIVELKVLGGMTQLHRSADFYALGVKNITGGETFIVIVTFGIDYSHQIISQEEVTPKLHQALVTSLELKDYGKDVRNVFVEFKEAAASSLDYLIVVTMNSAAAPSYYAVGRAVQQTCVSLCNRESWGIPFAQLTVNQGEGFDGLRASPPPLEGRA